MLGREVLREGLGGSGLLWNGNVCAMVMVAIVSWDVKVGVWERKRSGGDGVGGLGGREVRGEEA